MKFTAGKLSDCYEVGIYLNNWGAPIGNEWELGLYLFKWYVGIKQSELKEYKMSNRREWLKLFVKTTRPYDYEPEELDAIDRYTDKEVDTIVEELREDLKEMVEKAMVFDDDFVEYLFEAGYGEGDEIDINELAIEFADWLAEETVSA